MQFTQLENQVSSFTERGDMSLSALILMKLADGALADHLNKHGRTDRC